MALQLGLVFEGVHLGHGAFHEQKDDALGAGAEVRRPRRQRARGGQDTRGILTQNARQGQVAETGTGGFQNIPAGYGILFQHDPLPSLDISELRRCQNRLAEAGPGGQARIRFLSSSGFVAS